MERLHVTQLKQGMVVAEPLIEKETGKLLLKEGMRLTNSLINKLENHNIKYVEIGDPYTLLINPSENMEVLLTNCYQTAMRKIISSYPEGSMSDDAFLAGKKLHELIRKIIADEKIRSTCINMQIVNFRSLLMTGVFASVYSMFVATVMGLNLQEIYNIGVAGLLHDVGLCEMPYLIGIQELPDNMRPLYNEHPTYAYYMLLEQGYSEEIASIIYAHHERYDGEGFPRGLKWMEIPIGSRILSLCSDYDSFISLHGMAPYEAVEYMYGNCDFSYDKSVVAAFTENIPIYPLGSMVELTTGEIGIVVNIRKNKGPRPIVRIYYNRVKKSISQPYLLDLGTEKTVFIQKIINV